MTDTRDRLMAATNESFRRRGFHGTSMSRITKAAAAPTGSLYHFFPGGKDELTAAVIAESGAAYRELFILIADEAADAPNAVTDFFEGAAAVLEETDYIDPCPIGTIAREVANTNEQLRVGAENVFASWIDTATGYLEEAGLPHDDAVDLATTVVAALEGGFVLARTRRDADVLRVIGHQIRALVATSLASVPTS